MTSIEHELDEYGKRLLTPLRESPAIDPVKAGEIKNRFLMQAESLRQDLTIQARQVDQQATRQKHSLWWAMQHKPAMKALFAVLLVVIIVLAGSSATVLAAQNSLPGDQLYPVKTWSENVRLSLTFSTQAKLNLILDYTNTRLNEITSLVAQGKMITDQISEQYQQELDNALQLAAQMNDQQMQIALMQIKNQAGNQGATIQELIYKLPPQAVHAMLQLEQRLNIQVQWSELGEADPQAFRMQLHERMQRQQGPIGPIDTEQPLSTPVPSNNMPMPGGNGGSGGNESIQPTQMPGNDGSGGNESSQPTQMPENDGSGNDQDQPMPGTTKHDSNPKHTASP